MSQHPLDQVRREPHTCIWEITRRCNLRCLHCENECGDPSSRELSLEKVHEVGRELVQLGGRRVDVTGGEPLMHPRWDAICRAEAQALALAPADMPELLRVLRRLARRPGLRPHLTDNIGYCTHDDLMLRTIQGGFPRPWLGCRAGLDALGVTSDGRVKGCLSLPDTCVEGNLRERSLAEIWNNADGFAYNRRFTPEQLGGACTQCRHSARCRGGCSATAYASLGRPGKSEHCLWLYDQ